jgi:hypothetical protein
MGYETEGDSMEYGSRIFSLSFPWFLVEVKLVLIYNNGKYDIRSINFGNRGINRDRNDYWSGMLLSPSGNLSHTSILYYDYDLHHTISILNTIHGQNTIGKS